uniref:hypothetical protein n=1 Tax=Alistipes sp. TaxID=1872444 RepID=UPI004056DB16
MILKCSIRFKPIIDSAQQQTSADFRALHSQNPQADNPYDDFVLTEDEYEQSLNELRGEITDSLYSYFRSSVVELFRDNPDGMYISFDVQVAPDLAVAESLIQTVLKYALLKWWYSLRSEAHFVAYTQKYIQSLQELNSLLRHRISYGVGSYY